ESVKAPENVSAPPTVPDRVGDAANTAAPEPVSSVRAAAKLALDGVARNVATPVPKPEIHDPTGHPVAFVSVMADGTPRAGVTSVGEVANTRLPVPVTVQFAVVGTAAPPELLHSAALLAMEARPMVPVVVIVPPVRPLLVATLVTV